MIDTQCKQESPPARGHKRSTAHGVTRGVSSSWAGVPPGKEMGPEVGKEPETRAILGN